MIILLSGMAAINKKFISRILLAKLNKYEYKGYTCDFSDYNFKIYKGSDLVFYSSGKDASGVISKTHAKDNLFSIEDGKDIFDYFNNINESVLNETISNSNFRNSFSDVSVDYGITDTPWYEVTDNKLLHPSTFNDVVKLLKESTLKTKIITGVFSKHFISKIKAEFKDEEVKVLNIIRNPSVSYVMGVKNPDEFGGLAKPDLTQRGEEVLFFASILNAIELMKDSSVITVKFEDIIKNGYINLDGEKIIMREDFCAYNDYICNGEKNIELKMSEEEYSKCAEYFKSYGPDKFLDSTEDEYNDYAKYAGINKTYQEVKEILKEKLPKDMIKELGYEIVQYDKIKGRN